MMTIAPIIVAARVARPLGHKDYDVKYKGGFDINGMKRFVADLEASSGAMLARTLPARTGKKAAVVGGGPPGLSAAW